MAAGTIVQLDVGVAGLRGAIGATLIVADEVALVDPGPATSLPRLEAEARKAGVPLGEVRHLLLTHVHLDHAGATGHLAARYPDLTVHVSATAGAHLVDPARLVASTRRTFGDDHDRLWGEVLPVPAHRIRGWRPGEPGPLPRVVRSLATPGHADHHLAYLDERDGTLVAGDALGILLAPGAPVHPATPPPGVDVGAWLASLEEVVIVGPERAAWSHFGVHSDPVARARELAHALLALRERVRAAVGEGAEAADADALAFDRESRDRLREWRGDDVDPYFDIFRAATDYAGMRRFVTRNPDWTPPPHPQLFVSGGE